MIQLTAAIAFVLPFPPASSSVNAGPLPVEVVVDLRAVTSAEVSADGEQILYTVSVPRGDDEEPGARRSEAWIAPFEGGSHVRYLSAQSEASAVRFSPDGASITFLRKAEAGDAVTQVWRMPLGGGEAEPITTAARSITSYRLSPDGARVAFTMVDEESDEEKDANEAGRDWTVVDESYRFTRLYVADLASGASHLVSRTDAQVWSFDWFPDGTRLIANIGDTTLTDDRYMFPRLAVYDAAGGDPATLFETEGKLGAPAISPDGRHVAWAGATSIHDPYAGSLFVGDVASGATRNLTGSFEATTAFVDFAPDGRILTVTLERQRSVLRVLPIDGRHADAEILWSGPPVFRSVSVAERGTRYVAAASTASHPREVFSGALDDSLEPRRRTWHNAILNSQKLGRQEVYGWTARDGLDIEGVLVKPVGYREASRYPLVVCVHGGPESAILDGWNTGYGVWTQLLATRGYMVLLPNYRASIGRGVEYSMLDHRDLAGLEFTDVLDGVDALIERGDVDGDRVGIGGGSYGGYFSMWAATRHTDRFAAAVAFAGISNWVSMLGTSDIPEENLLVHWNLPARGNMLRFMERSPVFWAEHSETPLLLLHGEKDLRVPLGQSTEMYTLMKLNGKSVRYVRYPREPHGIRERAHQIDFATRSIGWFDQHVKGVAPEG